MITYKYKKEYELELETVDGKVKQKYNYIGPYFACEEKMSHRKACLFLLIIYIVFAAALFVNLYLYSNLAKTLYIILPTGLNAVCAFLAFAGLYVFWPERDQLTREQKDKGINRLKAAGFFKLVFCFSALVGSIIFFVNFEGTKVREDYIFLVNTAITAILSLVEFFILHTVRLKEN